MDPQNHIYTLLKSTNAAFLPHRNLPYTPLRFNSQLSDEFNVKLFIKAEDCLDTIGSGHKVRKLSYIVADALKKKATVLVTIGSLPSNQCKAVANIAWQNGLRAHVIYVGDLHNRPNLAQGNYFLTSMFDPTLTWYEKTSWECTDQCLEEVAHQETKNGEHPYVVPSGASIWPGIIGSIELGFELAYQAKKLDLGSSLDIVLPAGSGGTALGLHVAAEILGLHWRIHGICIGESARSLRKKIIKMKSNFIIKFSNITANISNLHFYDEFLGLGYNLPTEDDLNEMQFSFKNYNLLLDYNYMLKAYLGLKELLKKRIIGKIQPIVLIHTGGQYGLFDNDLLVKEWHKKKYKNWLKEEETGIIR